MSGSKGGVAAGVVAMWGDAAPVASEDSEVFALLAADASLILRMVSSRT